MADPLILEQFFYECLTPVYNQLPWAFSKKWQHKNVSSMPWFIYKLYDTECKFKGLVYKVTNFLPMNIT